MFGGTSAGIYTRFTRTASQAPGLISWTATSYQGANVALNPTYSGSTITINAAGTYWVNFQSTAVGINDQKIYQCYTQSITGSDTQSYGTRNFVSSGSPGNVDIRCQANGMYVFEPGDQFAAGTYTANTGSPTPAGTFTNSVINIAILPGIVAT